MKAKILIMVVLMSFSAVLVAQPGEYGPKKSFRGPGNEVRMNDNHRSPVEGLDLTDAQKEEFKKSMMVMQKELKPLRNELGEVQAHQRTLVSADEPDLKAINKNLDKIGELKTKMAKIQVKQRLDLRAQLTEEQRMKFDMFKHRMKDQKSDMVKSHMMGMNNRNRLDFN